MERCRATFFIQKAQWVQIADSRSCLDVWCAQTLGWKHQGQMEKGKTRLDKGGSSSLRGFLSAFRGAAFNPYFFWGGISVFPVGAGKPGRQVGRQAGWQAGNMCNLWPQGSRRNEASKEGRSSRKEQISPIEGLETCCSRAGGGLVVEEAGVGLVTGVGACC